MNLFTTDHPLAAQPSWFDTQKHPVLSFVCSSIVLAFILAPWLLYRLYLYALSDIGAESNPFPQPWWALFWGSVFAFVLSLFVAVLVVFLFRLFVSWRRRYVVA